MSKKSKYIILTIIWMGFIFCMSNQPANISKELSQNIENLLKSVLYSIFTIILFIVNLKLIKISNIKELIIVNGISIICTFIVVLMVWYKYKFDININMMWIIYPLYLCGDYFMKIHEKYLIYEENLSEENKSDYMFKKTVC